MKATAKPNWCVAPVDEVALRTAPPPRARARSLPLPLPLRAPPRPTRVQWFIMGRGHVALGAGHKRIEVLYLGEHEEDDGKGEWWAGKVGASVSRWRGLQVVFDREPREPPTYFTDIIMATKGSLWRHEVKRFK